jgi:hypothetical protein
MFCVAMNGAINSALWDGVRQTIPDSTPGQGSPMATPFAGPGSPTIPGMYIIAIAWIYVVLLMAFTEPSVAGGVATFLLYGLAPLALLLYLLSTPQRRRNRRRREALAREEIAREEMATEALARERPAGEAPAAPAQSRQDPDGP